MDSKAPGNPFQASVQYSSPETISSTTGFVYEDPLASEHEFGRVIPTNVNGSLCKYCRKLAVDVLASPAAPSAGWEIIHSDYYSLSYLKEHNDGTKGSLVRSANDCCDLCTLIDEELQRLGEHVDLNQTYQIFVWTQVPRKCEFLLALGSSSRFLEHISLWDVKPISIIFFRRNGFDTNWSYLNKQLNFRDGLWPSLPAWPNQFPDSEEAIHRAQCWLSECVSKHKSCSRSEHSLPKRVLDLGQAEYFDRITLYVTRGEVAPYVTLSYSWGSSLPLKTTSSNINEHCAGILLEEFPKTLRDAILITKRLGFRYLWIDALCIIQGHDGDWAEQAAAMTDIYQGSTFTISALSSSDCDSGMLTKLPDHGFRVGTYSYPDNNVGDIFIGTPGKVLDLGAKALSTRGWTFQERLVSVASLHYTDEGMVWECASGIFPENDQGYRQFEWKSDWKTLVESRLIYHADQTSQSRSMNVWEHQYDLWNSWVSEFSARKLSFSTDKLPAMAGIARSFAMKFRLRYVAGLWEENLISGLLWQRHHTTSKPVRFGNEVAPSWSWASIEGRLKYRNIKISAPTPGADLRILRIEVKEDQPGTFGRVHDGIIEAEGLLQEVVVDRSLHPTPRKHPHQECGIVQGVIGNANFICMLDDYVEAASVLYPCWCLQVGPYNANGRESWMFLLLEKACPYTNKFRRVGIAEIDAWENTTVEVHKTHFFSSGQWLRFTLV